MHYARVGRPSQAVATPRRPGKAVLQLRRMSCAALNRPVSALNVLTACKGDCCVEVHHFV